jgi:rhamnosyltransferase
VTVSAEFSDVFLIVVTYNPELSALDELLRAISPQVTAGIIVDNGSNVDLREWLGNRYSPTLTLHTIGQNIGIAAAQNIGLEQARQARARFVLLSDQDSVPSSDMVSSLRVAHDLLHAQGRKIAALGPRYKDSRQNNPPPFIQVKGLRVHRQYCSNKDSIVEVDYVIASGCLIPMPAIDAAGPMREELFIDYVDIEWGLRAKYHGLQSFGVCAATMAHSLGDQPISFMGRHYPLHSALRHYYHFRNAVWLYKQSFIPLQWKITDAYRLLRKYGFYTLFAKPRATQFWMMTRGMFHGAISRLGKLGSRASS